jgi:predicted aldo/keto reductase-like oxidoreductase
MLNNWVEGKRLYNILVKDVQKASNCIACGECLEKCPQQIPIPQMMDVVVEKYGA